MRYSTTCFSHFWELHKAYVVMFSSQNHLQTGKSKSILYSPAHQSMFKEDGVVLVLNVGILLLLLHDILLGSAE